MSCHGGNISLWIAQTQLLCAYCIVPEYLDFGWYPGLRWCVIDIVLSKEYQEFNVTISAKAVRRCYRSAFHFVFRLIPAKRFATSS